MVTSVGCGAKTQTTNANYRDYRGKLTSWLNPSGISVSSLSIQKSSRFSKNMVTSSSVKVILTCLVKSWPGVEKCRSTRIESCCFFRRSGGYLFLDWRLVRFFRCKACNYTVNTQSNR